MASRIRNLVIACIASIQRQALPDLSTRRGLFNRRYDGFLSWSESLRDHKPMVLQGICPGLEGGRPNFYGKGQHPLLWAGS